MKKLSLLILTMIAFYSCQTEVKKSKRGIILGDTITTKSGLKYIFLKEGNGRKVEENSKVSLYTDLYLNDDKKVFWTTSTAQDSLFTYIQGKTSLIAGFTEVGSYLAEGDEVIAILPYQLAYGERENRGIPAKSTLIYDPMIIKSVSEPKEVLADTLFSIAKTQGATAANDFYKNVISSDAKNNYHMDLDLLSGMFVKLERAKKYAEMETMTSFFIKNINEAQTKQMMYYYHVMSLEAQEKLKEATSVLETLSNQQVNQEYWKNYLKNVKSKLK